MFGHGPRGESQTETLIEFETPTQTDIHSRRRTPAMRTTGLPLCARPKLPPSPLQHGILSHWRRTTVIPTLTPPSTERRPDLRKTPPPWTELQDCQRTSRNQRCQCQWTSSEAETEGCTSHPTVKRHTHRGSCGSRVHRGHRHLREQQRRHRTWRPQISRFPTNFPSSQREA